MSTTVDNRVVSMTFDNSRFEKNVKTSLDTLNNLNDKLKFTGSTKGLENIDAAAKRLDFATMSNGVQNVVAHFKTMDIVGAATLMRITNAAITAGKNLFNMFAIEPVTTGFQEYELKMGSVQTIMASTGASLDEVNGYLAELNEYSDKTIYSFSDMTSSIGKFTNAGVSLDKAVLAIKGISNEAAISGANAQQASHAMYNFAQALSAGSVKLMDWKSIELANMATVEFKNELINTAVELGTLTKSGDKYISTTTNLQGHVSEAFNATSMFNESLNSQWMTTDVLVETLGRYADASTDLGKKAYASAQDVKTFSMMMDTLKEAAQSGWAETWEILVGDFEESKQLWTSMSNFFGEMIGNAAESRNKLLGDIFNSPWEKLTDQIAEAGIQTEVFNDNLMVLARDRGVDIDGLLASGKELSDLVQDGTITGDMLRDTINGLAESADGLDSSTDGVTQKLVNLEGVVRDVMAGEFGNGADRFEALTEAGYDYAQVQDLVNKTIQNGAADYEVMSDEQLKSIGFTDEEIEGLRRLSDEANSAGSSLSDLIDNMQRPSGSELVFDTIRNVLDYMSSVAGTIKEAWHSVFSINPDVVYSLIEWAHSLSENLVANEGSITTVSYAIKGIFNVLDIGVSIIKSIVKPFGQLVGHIKDFDLGISDGIKSFSEWTTSIANAARDGEFLSTILEDVNTWFGYVADQLSSNVWPGFVDVLDGVRAMVSNVLDNVRELGEAIKDCFSSKVDAAVSGIEQVKTALGNLWQSIKDGVKLIKGKFVDAIQGVTEKFGDVGFGDIINTGIGAGIGAGIWKLVKMFKGNSFTGAAASFADLMDTARGAIKTWQTEIKVDLIKSIAVSVAILSASIVALAMVDADKVQNGLGAVSVLLLEVASVATMLDKMNVSGSASAALTVVILAGALAILSTAMGNLKDFNSWDTTWPALLSMIALMGTLVAACKALSTNVDAGAIIKVSVALALFAGAFKLLSMALLSLSPDEMQTAAVRLGIIMGGLVVFIKLVSNSQISGVASTLIALSVSMAILAGAIKLISLIETDEIVKGLITIGIMMGELAVAVRIMNGANIRGVAVTIIALAVAMNLMLIPMAVLGHMDWTTITKGLVGIGGALLAMAGAVALMGSFGGTAPQMLAMSVAVIAMAAAMNMLIIPIAALGALPIPVIVTGLAALLVAFAGFGVVGAILSNFAMGLLAVSGAFALFGAGVLAIGSGLALLSAGFATLAAVGTAGAAALIASMTVLVVGLTAMMPALAKLMTAIITSLAMILIESAPVIAAAVGAIVESMLKVAATLIPGVVELLLQLLDSVLEGLANHIPAILNSIEQIFIAILSAITGKEPDVLQEGVNTVKSFVGGLLDTIWYVTESIATIMTEFITGIVSFFSDIYDKGVDVINELIQGVTEGNWDGILDAGWNFVSGIWQGISSGIGWIHSKISGFAKGLLNTLRRGLDEHSPSKATAKMGKFFDEGFGLGVVNGMRTQQRRVQKFGSNMVDALEVAISKTRDVLNDTGDLNPVIAPVLDLSNIQNGASRIGKILGDNSKFGATSAYMASVAARNVDARSSRENDRLLKAIEKLANKSEVEPQPINNTYYITSNNPREVAQSVSAVMQRNYERKNKAWAK